MNAMWNPGDFDAQARAMQANGADDAAAALWAAAANVRNTGSPGVACHDDCRCRDDVRRVLAGQGDYGPGRLVWHVEPDGGAAVDVVADPVAGVYELRVFLAVQMSDGCDDCGGG